jgi:membrane-associated phospholipid phosphatase
MQDASSFRVGAARRAGATTPTGRAELVTLLAVQAKSTVALAFWLLLLTAAQAAAVAAVGLFFVATAHGQHLDTIALAGNTIGRSRIDELVDTVLNAVSVAALAIATAVIGFIALARGRRALALMAILLIVGSNATTQVLKYVIERPDLGIDSERAAAGNSFPSGHATVAASVAIALVLVLPPTARGLAALLGAGYAGLSGVATMSAGWHRPSDAIAAVLVVGAWTSAVGFALVLVRRWQDVVARDEAHPVASGFLLCAGLCLLAVAAAGLWLTDAVVLTPPSDLSRRRLFAAYAGSAADIAGTACVVVGLVLATVHRVVPRRVDPRASTVELPSGAP